MAKELPPHLQKGVIAEQRALNHLLASGLTLHLRNYRTPYGEIDLIMFDQKQESLVFVEVRYRNSGRFGGPAESITRNKQKKLVASAEHFRQHNPQLARCACRFDVISICGDLGDGSIQWDPNAF